MYHMYCVYVPYQYICTNFYQLSRAKEENQELVKNYSHLQSKMSTVVESNSLQVITLEQKV